MNDAIQKAEARVVMAALLGENADRLPPFASITMHDRLLLVARGRGGGG